MTDEHKHEWKPVGVVSEDDIQYSPVSRYDHTIQTNQYAVTSCVCGAVRRTLAARGEVRWLNR